MRDVKLPWASMRSIFSPVTSFPNLQVRSSELKSARSLSDILPSTSLRLSLNLEQSNITSGKVIQDGVHLELPQNLARDRAVNDVSREPLGFPVLQYAETYTL